MGWLLYYLVLQRRTTLWRPKLLQPLYRLHLPIGTACAFTVGAFSGGLLGFTCHLNEVNIITTKHTAAKDSPAQLDIKQNGVTHDRSSIAQQDRYSSAQFGSYPSLEQHELATVTEDNEVIGLEG